MMNVEKCFSLGKLAMMQLRYSSKGEMTRTHGLGPLRLLQISKERHNNFYEMDCRLNCSDCYATS